MLFLFFVAICWRLRGIGSCWSCRDQRIVTMFYCKILNVTSTPLKKNISLSLCFNTWLILLTLLVYFTREHSISFKGTRWSQWAETWLWRHKMSISSVFYNKPFDKWQGEGWTLSEQILLVAGNIYTNINTFKQSFTLLSIHLWCCNNTRTAATCYVIEVSFTVGQLWYLMLWGKLKVIAITRLASAVEWFLLGAWKNVHVRWILCFVCLAQQRRWVRWTPGIRNSVRPPFYSAIYSAPALATRRNYSY